MALSILNYFYWDIPEARVPFVVADAVVIVALHYVDRGLKAEKALAELKAEKDHQQAVTDKDNKRMQKAAVRDEQKRNMKNQKHLNGANMNAPTNIHQPKKSR